MTYYFQNEKEQQLMKFLKMYEPSEAEYFTRCLASRDKSDESPIERYLRNIHYDLDIILMSDNMVRKDVYVNGDIKIILDNIANIQYYNIFYKNKRIYHNSKKFTFDLNRIVDALTIESDPRWIRAYTRARNEAKKNYHNELHMEYTASIVKYVPNGYNNGVLSFEYEPRNNISFENEEARQYHIWLTKIFGEKFACSAIDVYLEIPNRTLVFGHRPGRSFENEIRRYGKWAEYGNELRREIFKKYIENIEQNKIKKEEDKARVRKNTHRPIDDDDIFS